jgi:uncharacterized protein (DUF1697 family)
MDTHVALLRGINVGGNNTVEMSKLKKIFMSLGYENVSTHINTGNIIFTTKEKDTKVIVDTVEKALKKNFKFAIRCVVRNSKNIEKVCKAIPKEWGNDTEQKTDVLFLWEAFDTKKSLNLIVQNKTVGTLKYVAGAIVWNVKRRDYKKSGMNKFIGSEVYKHMTARNVNTVRKLREMMSIR